MQVSTAPRGEVLGDIWDPPQWGAEVLLSGVGGRALNFGGSDLMGRWASLPGQSGLLDRSLG